MAQFDVSLKVNSQEIAIVETCKLVANSVNLYTVVFEFNGDWDQFTKTAVFTNGLSTISQILDENNSCTIPKECLIDNSKLKIGVSGIYDSIVMPTVWTKELFVFSGAKIENPSPAPTPRVIEQIISETADNRERAEAAAEDAQGYAQTANDAKTDAVNAKEAAQTAQAAIENMTVSSEAATGTTPSVEKTIIEGVVNINFKLVPGDEGNGIVSITKTGSVGLVDTYTITYTDGNSSTFTVTNGETSYLASVSLSNVWSGNDPYTQNVTVTGANIDAHSLITIQASDQLLSQMITDGCTAIRIDNQNGNLIAVLHGAPLSTAITLQVVVTEVAD